MGTINNATYGRSHSALGTVQGLVQKQCSTGISKLKGQEYKDLIAQVQKYWAGTDANDWLKDLNNMIKSISDTIDTASRTAQSLLTQDYNNFVNQQKKNITK